MPTGTKVEKCFIKLKGTMPTGRAAAICQSTTGQSLSTGKPLGKGNSKKNNYRPKKGKNK